MAIVHTVYAFVYEGMVRDVTVSEYYEANVLCREIYGSSAIAVDVTQYPVAAGDRYNSDGTFERYNETAGTWQQVPRMKTDDERIDELERTNALLMSVLNTAAAAITDIVEESGIEGSTTEETE